jgi:hypothetical protein
LLHTGHIRIVLVCRLIGRFFNLITEDEEVEDEEEENFDERSEVDDQEEEEQDDMDLFPSGDNEILRRIGQPLLRLLPKLIVCSAGIGTLQFSSRTWILPACLA